VLAHPRDDHRPLLQGVALVARLRPHREQPVAGDEALRHFVVDRRGRRPRGRLERSGQLGEIPRVERVGLRAAQLGLGAVVGLARVDHRDPVAGLVQRHREGHPGVPRRFHDDQYVCRGRPARRQPPLQGREAGWRLLCGERAGRLTGPRAPRGCERIGRDVDANVALIRDGPLFHLSLRLRDRGDWRSRDDAGLRS